MGESVDLLPEALSALALGPALRRLRQVLERCEQRLGEERNHHQAMAVGRGSQTASNASKENELGPSNTASGMGAAAAELRPGNAAGRGADLAGTGPESPPT